MTVQTKLLRCILCDKKYSELDVENLNFFPDSLVCFDCYDKGSKQDHRVWCFGKKNKLDSTGQPLAFGYDPRESQDCRLYCPDRKACYLFATGKISRLRALTKKTNLPFKTGSITAKAFAACVLGTTRTKLRALIRKHGGNVLVVMRKLRLQKMGTHTWKYVRKEEKVRIEL